MFDGAPFVWPYRSQWIHLATGQLASLFLWYVQRRGTAPFLDPIGSSPSSNWESLASSGSPWESAWESKAAWSDHQVQSHFLAVSSHHDHAEGLWRLWSQWHYIRLGCRSLHAGFVKGQSSTSDDVHMTFQPRSIIVIVSALRWINTSTTTPKFQGYEITKDDPLERLTLVAGKADLNIRWMEEILHHLGWLKPYKWY